MNRKLIRRLYFIPLLLCLWLPNINFAQAQKTISGKVTDDKNNTLPGVSISIKDLNLMQQRILMEIIRWCIHRL